MTQRCIPCLLLLLCASRTARGQEIKWVDHLVAGTSNFASYVDVDGDGNYYITGYFGGALSFGGQTLSGDGAGDVFIAKYAPSRQLQWVKQGTSPGWDAGRGIAVDGDGNVFVVGYFNGETHFDGATVSAVGGDDGFVAKYSADGTIQWAKSGGGSGTDWTNTVAVDGQGNSYAVGYFTGGATFGSTSLVSNGAEDIFIVSYAPDGTLRWVKNAGGSGSDIGYGIKADAAGNVYVTGQFAGTANFSGRTINGGTSTGFLAKYNTDGTIQWVKGLASTNNSENLSMDGQGNIYVVGAFVGTATFDSHSVTSAGSEDIYIAKYDVDGNALAAWRVGGSGHDGVAGFGQSSQVIVQPDGGFFLASSFESTVTANGKSVQSAGDKDILLAQFDKNGQALWMLSGGGSDFDGFIGLGVDKSSGCYLFGNFFSALFKFGTNQLPRFGGFADMFLAKVDASGADGLPHIALSKDALDVGEVTLGTPESATLSVGARTNVPLQVTKVYFDDPQSAGSKGFEIILPTPDLLPATLSGSQKLDVAVRFLPAAPGPAQTSLVIETNDPASPKTTVSVTATGIDGSSQPRIVLSATQINIGDVWLGTQREGSLMISPANGAGLVIESIDFEDPASIDDGFDLVSPTSFPITLHGGEQLQVKVAFIPPDLGSAAAKLVIVTNDENKPFTKVNVSAAGTEAPVAELSRTALDFGTVNVGTPKRESFTIRSGSSGTLQVTDVELQSGEAAGFRVVAPAPGSTFPMSLNQGQELTVTIEFTPPKSGGAQAVLIVGTNDPSALTRQVSLTGTGTSTTSVPDDNASEKGLELVRVTPNPLRDEGEVHLNIPSSGEMNVELIDLNGRILVHPFQGHYQEGPQAIPLNVRSVASGTYLCVVDINGKRYHRLVTITR